MLFLCSASSASPPFAPLRKKPCFLSPPYIKHSFKGSFRLFMCLTWDVHAKNTKSQQHRSRLTENQAKALVHQSKPKTTEETRE